VKLNHYLPKPRELRKSRFGHGFDGCERIHTDIHNYAFMVFTKTDKEVVFRISV
jgi:hypothetical protein